MNQNGHSDQTDNGLCHLVFLDEDLHNQHQEPVKETLDGILANGFREGHLIEIHFGDLHKFDQGVMGIIWATAMRVRERGGDLQLVITNAYIKEKIRMWGFESAFTVFSSNRF